MSLLKEGLLAVGATAVAIAGCATPVRVDSQCKENPQRKIIEVDIGDDFIFMGKIRLTRGNNPAGEFDARLIQEGTSELSMDFIKKESPFREPETGNTVKIRGEKAGNDDTRVIIEVTCDQPTDSTW